MLARKSIELTAAAELGLGPWECFDNAGIRESVEAVCVGGGGHTCGGKLTFSATGA